MSDSNQPSTIGSYASSGLAAVQNAIGSLTGNPVDKQQASDRKAAASTEHDASHAAAKAGPFNVSSSGAATIDSKDRRDGKQDQVIGSGKEFVGNMIGSEQMKSEGRAQNQQGQGQEAAGQIKDYAGGVADRVGGTIGSATAGILGNQQAKDAYAKTHDAGKTNQRSVETELSKQ